MKVRNFWLQKRHEKNLLKVVEWAQSHRIKVEDLTKEQIREAMRLQRK